MFEKLKKRWKVNSLNLVLIITTFALGGSLCGFAGRQLLKLFNIENNTLWIILYILLITLLWPICVLLVSVPLGQFGFFKKYINKILKRFLTSSAPSANETIALKEKKVASFSSTASNKINIAIFASGAGSNAQKIIDFFSKEKNIVIALIVCNKPGAGVIAVAESAAVPVLLIEKERFFKGDYYLPELHKYHIDWIILAGFLWKLPETVIKAYPKKIVNIHPALLPKYGGNGMYGNYVHEAVIGNKEKESGITIHYVDELYDHGEIIFQAKCNIDETETTASLASKIHKLEHEYYPKIIEGIIKK